MSWSYNFYFRFLGSFQCYGIFCCQSVSKQRDTVLMNCEFSDPKEPMVMVAFIHLHFSSTAMVFILQMFMFWPRDSTRLLL